MATNPQPHFRFFLANDAETFRTGDALWRRPMPLVLADVVGGARHSAGRPVTYGDYFRAIRAYLRASLFEPLGRTAVFHGAAARSALKEIRIHLEKHGQYYHPARVGVVATGNRLQHYVVNVALSPAGEQILQSDFIQLERLNAQYPYDFLPQVYHCGRGRVRRNFAPAMFLGQWLEDYHEFHAADRRVNAACIRVWDPKTGPRALSPKQAAAVYRRAAAILTAYYNPYSFEHIAAWHHAAGDFVVRLASGGLDVKLITVRAYTPLFRGLETDPQTLIQALLLFLLKLSLQMRLDRLDGTGEMVWLEDFSLAATLRGFWDGLGLQAEHGLIPADFGAHFLAFVKGLRRADLSELLVGVAQRFPPADAGTELIRANLTRHLAALRSTIENLTRPQ